MSMNISEEMRPEYDFSTSVQGKHYRAYQEGTNIVFLEPDIAEVFKDSEAVNHALRLLLNLMENDIVISSSHRHFEQSEKS
uniref:Uncharacterized protein n=1 Tax=Candidatus Kentrum sp. MB TaxID=2138164 RepID=A0A450XPL6_9GAMM|nr:MAG: hypothetical protein BECKMB1821G_GA0114241_108112 [Candidatus Kentron sp. MB]